MRIRFRKGDMISFDGLDLMFREDCPLWNSVRFRYLCWKHDLKITRLR